MLNKVILIGTLGKDPEIRSTGSGKKVANISLATSESYKDKNGEKHTETEWHELVFWGKITEVIEKYLKKGSKIYVEGKIKTEVFEKDGEKKYFKKIIGSKIVMLGDSQKKEEVGKSGLPVYETSSEEEDLPW